MKRIYPLIFLIATPIAMAQGEGATIKLGGSYQVTAKTGSATAVGLGANPRSADLNIAGIQLQNGGFSLGRDYRSDIRTGSVAAISVGPFGTGPVNIGGIQARR